MATVDLTPFGFTPTESLAYATLLRLGPTTGYAVAHGARLARANAYAALAGLVARGAAFRAAGRPVRFRPADPTTLVAHLAAQQGEALDRLSRSLRDSPQDAEPLTREVAGRASPATPGLPPRPPPPPPVARGPPGGAWAPPPPPPPPAPP